jgi:DNA-binding SARP family transcriptional activator
VTRPESGRFRVRTLGQFELTRDGRTFDIRVAKQKALLAYLALSSGGAATRSRLASLLWDRADPANARTSLRQALTTLKAALGADYGDLIRADADRVHLNLALCDVDALQLTGGPLDVEPLLNDGAPTLAFLSELDPRSAAFDDWVAQWRAECAERLVARLEAALREANALGDSERVLKLGRAVLSLDPLHEAAHGAMIAAYALQGRHGLAKAHAEQASRAFRTELGVTVRFAGPYARLSRPVAMHTDDRRAIVLIPAAGAEDFCADIVGHLSRSLWLRVHAATSNASGAPPGALHVQASLRADETHLQLTSPVDGTVLWTDAVRWEPATSEAVLGAAARLEVAVLAGEAQRCLGTEAADDAGGWDRLMRAYGLFWRTSRRNNEAAARILDDLIADEPENPRALSLRSFVYMAGAWSGWADDVDEACRAALRLARRATRAEGRSAWALFTLATAETTCVSLDQAERTMRHALSLAPALAAAHGELGRMLALRGDRPGAEAACGQAAALAPNDPHASLWAFSRAVAAFAEADYDAARRACVAAAAIRGEWFQNELLHAACAARLGERGDAGARLSGALRKAPGYSLAALKVGFPFATPATFDDFVDALTELGWNG